jgi:Fe-S cluster assembly protein SufB
MELSTYFRINQAGTGQFERTLLVADEGSYVSYLEVVRLQVVTKINYAAVVELIALDDAEIKYSTVQNWYPGNKEGKGGVYNFVTKEGFARKRKNFLDTGRNRFRYHLEIPISGFKGDNSTGEFYSIAVTNNSKLILEQNDPFRKNTKSTIISKGISEDLKIATVDWYAFHQMQITQEIFAMRLLVNGK